MDIVFYGAGSRGKRALDVYRKKISKPDPLIGFADSKKTEDYCGFPMMPLSVIKKKRAAVVITIMDPKTVVAIYDKLKTDGIKDIFWFADYGSVYGNEDFLKEECVSCGAWGDCVLPGVEMHIMDGCNLNCKGCTHFSPIFEKELPDFESRIRDVKLLKDKLSHIMRFSILGGEPFLNPDIDLYIAELRNILPTTYIQIVTNGLLIPGLSDETMQCIRNNKIAVSISEYEPTHRIIDKIEARLKQAGVLYEIRRYESKQKFIRPLSISQKSIYSNQCISDGCVNIWNGKISRCPTLMYIDSFNKHFHTELPNEGIMQLKDCPDGSELLEILQKKIPLCKHCICCEMEWEQCGKSPKLSDFATDL